MASAGIGDPQSLNLFAYVTNNPIDFVDPSGLNASGCSAEFSYSDCGGDDKFWGSDDRRNRRGFGGGSAGFGDAFAWRLKFLGDLPADLQDFVSEYLNRMYDSESEAELAESAEAGGRIFEITWAIYEDGTFWTFFEISVGVGIRLGDWRVQRLAKGAKDVYKEPIVDVPIIGTIDRQWIVDNVFTSAVSIAGSPIRGGVAVGSTTTTSTSATSLAEIDALIARGLANPKTRKLTRQLIEHQKKLLEYVRDPIIADNKGFLRNVSQERFDQVYRTRAKSLTSQIKNFYKQIKNGNP